MTRFVLTAAALALSLGGAALAQDAPAPATPGTPWQMPRADDPPAGEPRPFELPDGEPGLLDGFLNDFISRAQPHLEGLARDMGGLMQEYGPALEELSRLIDDIGNYELPPERLPNGDILIRRKADAPPPPPLDDVPNLAPRQDRPRDPLPAPAQPPGQPPGQLPGQPPATGGIQL